MFEIDMCVWSRNRGAQLDLNLRSTKEHFKNIGNIFILWKADNEKFKQGYEKSMGKDYGLNIEFIEEKDFENDIKNILSSKVETEYVLGNSDDNIFIREVFFDNFNLSNEIVAFSLRLGKSINYCLPADIDLEQPAFFLEFDRFLIWNWNEYNENKGGWGYPHPCDSNIYKTQYWIDLIRDGGFDNPRQLEDWMNAYRKPECPYMISFNESHLISIQANDLGQGANIKTNGISLEELNNKFLDGFIISTDNIYNIQPNSCHILLKYEWVEQI